MATNGTTIAARLAPEEEVYGIRAMNEGPAPAPREIAPPTKRTPDDRADKANLRSAAGADATQGDEHFVLEPLVHKIAFGIASGLAVAMKELEQHIAIETRKVGATVERRLDTLQISLQQLSAFVGEQRSTNAAVADQLQQLRASSESLREADARQTAEVESLRNEAREHSATVLKKIDLSTASLRECDAKQASEIEALRMETRDFSSSVSQRIDLTMVALQETEARHAKDLAALQEETRVATLSILDRINSLCGDYNVQQEDIAAAKANCGSLDSRVSTLVERLDRQAEAVRLMHTNYSQRETELEQLVNGLARLRAFPTPLPTTGL